MIVILKKGATESQIQAVKDLARDLGLHTENLSQGEDRIVLGIVGNTLSINENTFRTIEVVENVMRVMTPYKLASREMKKENSVVKVDGVKFGTENIVLIAGPCSVESKEQIIESAHAIKESGAQVLRGSIFKPRTSPYEFQGMGLEGLRLLDAAREQTGLPIETEVMDPRQVSQVEESVDMLRVGARNMQNYDLLRQVGKSEKPVILKRGLCATVKEFLLAAEYIMQEGNQNVILCERGIRTFSTDTRFTLDLNVVPLLKGLTHLPIIVDPSHGTGIRELITPMSRAAVACGADGLLIEVHPNPKAAKSDAQQQLTYDHFRQLVVDVEPIAGALGRSLGAKRQTHKSRQKH
ncbi:3-deoxy-7-phosphoheptulonate synthase [Candidatus Parvarchaeota archaeon]|nr:3-deoxy-7-phosphoheptulonate synthase [Candidatus Parvarchaeota archaeon]